MSFGGYAAPLVQGSSSRSELTQRLVVLSSMVAGLLLGSVVLGLLLATARYPLSALIGADTRSTAAALLIAGLGLGDLWAAARRRLYPIGARRQTRQMLMFQSQARKVALTWGFDAGLGVTTYRVTSGIWVLCSCALLSVVAPWAVLVYSLGFCFGLLAVVLLPVRRLGSENAGDAALRRIYGIVPRRHQAQLIYLVVLVVAGVVVVGG